MNFDDLIVLLPCYSIEDLPLEWTPEEAHELLSAWSAAYHPAALASAGRILRWVRAGEPPADPSGKLILVPRPSESRLPADWLEQTGGSGACVVRNLADRPQMIEAILDCLKPDLSRLDSELTGDFLALGFCHLQVELLTRQLRYMSNLDTDRFQRESVAGAKKAMEGDTQAARAHVQSAFDLLTESREYFYPVEAHLLDLTLVAPTTLGEALRKELSTEVPVNLLLSGETLEQMACREPATLAALKTALEKGTATIVGGEYREQELPLISVEDLLSQLSHGLEVYQRHLGCRPKIFARRRFGLTPLLPPLLQGLGFTGALHFTLDDGRFPSGNQSKIRWEGVDGTTIESLARLPIDAARSKSFFKLAESLGNTMDLDHAATAVFAHWPGLGCPWYSDLRRMAAYSPSLGRFTSMTAYFESTQLAGQTKRYTMDEYRSPYLRQAVADGQPDPISRWVRHYRRQAAVDSLRALHTQTCLVLGRSCELAPEGLSRAVNELPDQQHDPLCTQLDVAAASLAASLSSADPGAPAGYLLVNPQSFARRLYPELPMLDYPPDAGGAVWRAAEAEGRKLAVVDVPAMGFAWLTAGAGLPPAAPPPKRWWKKANKPEPPLAEPYVLRNEFFEATIDPITGAIKSVNDYTTRGNRLAAQIAFRMPRAGTRRDTDEESLEQDYSVMAADEISVSSGPLEGRIVSRGRLLDRQGRRLAGFSQTATARRGSRVLELEIELDPEELPGPDPWTSYYAARFAWGDETADIYRGVGMLSQPTEAVLLESPQFIDIRSEKTRTTLLTGGLPYHRRFGLRKLDTLLVVCGETSRRFRIGIGIDVAYPVTAALDFLSPVCLVPGALPPQSSSGWLCHIDARNVVATDWEPLVCDAKVEGFRVRLLETEGRSVHVGLRSFRPIQSARKTNLLGEDPVELPVEGDRVTIHAKGHQWIQAEVRFQ